MKKNAQCFFSLLFMLAFLSDLAVAATLDVDVHYRDKTIDLPGAVVYFEPVEQLPSAATGPLEETIFQQNSQFRPYISVVQTGTAVFFPNRDTTAHHVYSFSPSKTFELPLYKQQQPDPVTFDTSGVVVLGCNIHDWMLAYLLIVDTPYFTQISSTKAAIEDLPPGEYTANLWYPGLKKPITQPLIMSGSNKRLIFKLGKSPKSYEQPETPVSGFDDDNAY